MAEDSDLEKTEAPTGRRIEQAREQGQVPHSRELGSFLVLIVSAGTVWFLGGWFVQRLSLVFRKGLVWDRRAVDDPEYALTRFSALSWDAVVAFWPLILALVLAALASPFLLNAWNFAPKAFTPDLTRLNPLNGIKRVFSWNGLVEMVKAVAKAGLIGGVAVWVIWREQDQLFQLLSLPLDAGLAMAGDMISWSFLLIVAAMFLIVAADVPFQLWQYYDKLKMTKEEVKQEHKEMEGSPEVKGRIRRLQREAAQRRMMSAVPKADVIVTNPTHFAVALAYTAGMRAPKVVAKGVDAVALRIREIGAEHGVPLLEAPPLARTLYRFAELEDEIPGALYNAVAEVLAYVYQLNRYREVGGSYPVPPRDLPIPQDMMVEAANG
ncbi:MULTISPECIES: flagellar biosynthesis protein FlhB [Azospira]|uniref:Flagellar biosynthetic protein FlhB n=2 Tax=Azospira oryzae TaxID=146939 RepID=G8QG34_AZOOP|nr:MULTISPECIES: flagellar biosynthesis protein FlhB [Azospira]AEV26107.1 flagellar biosynthetic protein FlhB [Azospira oryzae PS]MBP7488682.1 flagellar type III secretion system protein FlhB [Azospira sp.]MDK9690417.1 flagellar biosynthesis protein FlhB [Azospira sp.]RZT75625.1 flagellar biosynthetic protein FlhB [Azospira oryzae]BBN90365.1 flagellar biosynthesis protein FlhB [Azospira sp. I09]